MGDILIKGMEMPKTGQIVLVEIDENGDVFAAYDGGRTKLTQHKAVPVPLHGDLVDRDETIEAGKSHPTYKNSKIVKAVVDKACCFLKTATVVIPANKEY